MGGRKRAAGAAVLSLLASCAPVRFDVPGAADEAAYAAAYPLYAEYCALSQIKKRPGFGAEIRGEIGGHAVFYLNGACKDAGAGYPVLRRCGAGEEDGAGLSMNAHFRNAKWVAAPGRDFFFTGGLAPGTAVTRDAYRAVRAEAMLRGVYDGVVFNDWVFDDRPAVIDPDTWRYEVSIGTDWAIGLARGRYCVRVPVTGAQMDRMIAFLNAENAPYRRGERLFRWSVFNDNCIHLAHNALAAAGLWPVWPTQRFFLVALFDFPVPRNEFVNLARRTNDAWLADPGAAYADLPARGELLAEGRLPAMPGSLVEAAAPMEPNAVYETGSLKMIFYDEPNLGSYQRDFDRIFAEPRYWDRAVNRAHFRGLARRALAKRRPLDWWLARAPGRGDPAGFARVYNEYYALQERLAAPGP